MRRSRNVWRMGLVGVGLVVALASVTVAVMPSLFSAPFRVRRARDHITTVPVRRTDLDVRMTTGGLVSSSEQTKIECELELIDFKTKGGGRMAVGGASTILSVVPEGTEVKKGDVLCVLDSSDYEEVVRQQMINVDRARSDYRQAELNLEVARMAVIEYRDGLMARTLKDLKGQIALAQSDYERSVDRLRWSKRMLEKGYLPRSQVSTEEFNLARQRLNLKKGRMALDQFEKYSAPLYLRILQTDVLSAESQLSYQTRRRARFEERLAYYQRQVEHCQIRAPHDGFLIYVTDRHHPEVRIEPGLAVRQRQDLFYLPDLTKMEVAALLHETVVKDVQPGMRARVRVESLPGRVIEGHVASVTQIPAQNFFNDVRNFIATVTLDAVPKGLRPGMSAEVDITTLQRTEALVIPAQALTVEQGQDICYVAHDEDIERREIKVGQAYDDVLEVIEGLDEGEEVVIDPTLVADTVPVVASVTAPAEENDADAPTEPPAETDAE